MAPGFEISEFSVASHGCDVFGRSAGSGPPVVALHGQLGTHADFGSLVRSAAPGLKVVACDLRGRGRSLCREASRHTWEAHVGDVRAVLDHAGIQRAALVGVSFGSGLAAACALAFPERVTALVLAAPVYRGERDGWLQSQLPHMKRTVDMGRAISSEGIDAAVLARPPSERERTRGRLAAHDPASIGAALVGIGRTQPIGSIGELSSLRLPALVVPGDDEVHPHQVGEDYAHALCAETADPDGWTEAALNFLRRL